MQKKTRMLPLIILLISFLNVLYISIAPPYVSAEENRPIIKILPDKEYVRKDDVFKLKIIAENVENLYAIEFNMLYNYYSFEVLDSLPDQPGTNITSGKVMNGDDSSIVLVNNVVDGGKITYVASFLGESNGFSGTTTIATVDVKAIDNIDFKKRDFILIDVKLADEKGSKIQAEYKNCSIYVDNTPPRIAEISTMGNEKIKVEFDEDITYETLSNLNNYYIANLDINNIEVIDQRTVILSTQKQVGGEKYLLYASNIADRAGNIIVEQGEGNSFLGCGHMYMEIEEEVYDNYDFYLDVKTGMTKYPNMVGFKISYDPEFLKFQEIQVPEHLSSKVKKVPGYNVIDEEKGIIEYMIKIYDDNINYLCDGECISKIKFKPLKLGGTVFNFINADIITSLDNSRIPTNAHNMNFYINPVYDINGKINAKRTNNSNTSVKLVAENRTAKIGLDGTFMLEKVKPGKYKLDIAKRGYLKKIINVNIVDRHVALNVDLIPGDLNGDNIIDISDCVKAGYAYGSKPTDERWLPELDYDANNLIDIYDIVNVTRNYGKQFKEE
ncbi:MAG: hypothetical protein PHP06_01825 [Clostridia bacterium]|nr:hypothetical protein [Clostridia bacterium]